MGTKIAASLRAGVLALALSLGLFLAGPMVMPDGGGSVAAQTEATEPANDDDGDSGRWGLLGLLGLAGLAGLLKRPARSVVVDDTGRTGSTHR